MPDISHKINEPIHITNLAWAKVRANTLAYATCYLSTLHKGPIMAFGDTGTRHLKRLLDKIKPNLFPVLLSYQLQPPFIDKSKMGPIKTALAPKPTNFFC